MSIPPFVAIWAHTESTAKLVAPYAAGRRFPEKDPGCEASSEAALTKRAGHTGPPGRLRLKGSPGQSFHHRSEVWVSLGILALVVLVVVESAIK